MSFAAATATGPIIVEPAEGEQVPYHYDDERIIFLSDVFYKTDAEMESGLQAVPFEWTGPARNTLVNGKGYGSMKRRPGDPKFQKNTCEFEVLRVSASKSYRFHFISGTAMTFVTIAMQIDHQKVQKTPLQVIEADGEYTEPYHTDRISIGSGQRYSVLLSKDTLQAYRGQGRFWLEVREVNRGRRRPSLIRIDVEDPDNTDKDNNDYQQLHSEEDYKVSYILSPTSFAGAEESLLDDKVSLIVQDDMPLRPLHGYEGIFPTSEEVTATLYLSGRDIEVYHTSRKWWGGKKKLVSVHWEIGADAYYGPPNGMPRLVAMKTDQQQFCPNPASYDSLSHYDGDNNIYAFEEGAVLDIILENMAPKHGFANDHGKFRASDSHPFHLHGAHYYDLGAGKADYSKSQVRSQIKSQIEENIKKGDILKRDTSMLYFYGEADNANNIDGWRAMRIKVESLGVWLFHCHSKSLFDVHTSNTSIRREFDANYTPSVLQHMLMGMGAAFAFGRPEDIRSLPEPPLDGWDSKEARNVFYTGDKNAKATSTVDVGVNFAKIKSTLTQKENWGETSLSQGPFGVKAKAG